MIDRTHDRGLRSWAPSADGHPEFPIQNLPLGVFAPPDGEPRGGVAIGDLILDIPACLNEGLFSGAARVAAEAAAGPTLNAYLALDPASRAALRARVCDILDADGPERSRVEPLRAHLLRLADDCKMHMPARVGDYTDFFAGIRHATNTGRLLRPETPLLANYKHLPIAYHGRASSVAESGADVRRPCGQRKPARQDAPDFGPSRNLDFELELGAWIGPGNALGEPVPIAEAAGHVAGFCLLNDWSARDLQGWEYQPLGPFLGKSFATSVSPWIVTAEALAPFRVAQPPRPSGDPSPLPYLLDADDQTAGALDIVLEAFLLTDRMREQSMPPHRLARADSKDLYWTFAQMVAHHASNGCNLRPGDLFGSGTISSDGPDGMGSLLEITAGGRQPIALPSGEERRFLEDGDELILRARCERDGFTPIGFGECRGRITAALTPG